MNWVPLRLWLSLMCSFQLLNSVAATIKITYPVQGVVYPPQGPDTVEWLYTSKDPSNITIYLATYNDGTLINNLRCLTWPTSSGSVYITMSNAAPPGDSWKWMFYDTSQPIDLGSNEIAESAPFLIRGATISTTSVSSGSTATATTPPTASPSLNAKSGLSAGAGAGIGVTMTIVFILICLLAAYCFRRRRQTSTTHSASAQVYAQHELGVSEHPTSRGSEDIRRSEPPRATFNMNETLPSTHHEMEGHFGTNPVPPPVNTNSNELSSAARNEMQHYPQVNQHSEMPGNTVTQVIPRKELPSHDPYEMPGHLRPNQVSPAISRKELPGNPRWIVQDSSQQG